MGYVAVSVDDVCGLHAARCAVSRQEAERIAVSAAWEQCGSSRWSEPRDYARAVVAALADAGLLADPAETERLRTALDEAQLRSIEARNPGIDMDEVRRSRLAEGTPEEQTPDERQT